MLGADQQPGRVIRFKVAAVRAAGFMLRCVGDGGCRLFGRFFGFLVWTFASKRRGIALENIALLTDLDERTRRKAARRSVKHYCLTALNFVRGFSGLEGKIEVDDSELLQNLLAQKRAIVIVSGHLGAWEVLLASLPTLFPERACLAIGRADPGSVLNAVEHDALEAQSVRLILTGGSMAKARLALGRDETMLALLADQNCPRDRAVFLPFLGKTAAVNKGPALLALQSGALLCPAYMIRTAKGYVLHLDTPLDPLLLEGDEQKKIHACVSFYNASLEGMVRRYPEQWLWMHRRWKNRPPDEKPAA